jgi:hypothetical protein
MLTTRDRLTRGFLWLGPIVAIANSVRAGIDGNPRVAAVWLLLGALVAIQALRDRLRFSLRKPATTLVLAGLAAVFILGVLSWGQRGSLADGAIDAYLALVCVVGTLWAGLLWKPPSPMAGFEPGLLRGAIAFGIGAGLFLVSGVSALRDGEVPIAITFWAFAAFMAAGSAGSAFVNRRFVRHREIAHRLGFEDLHEYSEARRSESVSLEQMAAETGLKPKDLRTADKMWEELRRRRLLQG